MVFKFFLFVKCLASKPHVFGSGNDRSLRLLNMGDVQIYRFGIWIKVAMKSYCNK